MTSKGYGQQFFATPPARTSGDGRRLFGSREEWQRAWRDIPADWKAPLQQVDAPAPESE